MIIIIVQVQVLVFIIFIVLFVNDVVPIMIIIVVYSVDVYLEISSRIGIGIGIGIVDKQKLLLVPQTLHQVRQEIFYTLVYFYLLVVVPTSQYFPLLYMHLQYDMVMKI